MKYAIYIILLFSLPAFGQKDSTKQFTKDISIQARDLENLVPLLCYNESTEDLFQMVQSKWATGSYPTGNTQVLIDSARNDAFIQLYRDLMYLPFGAANKYVVRVQAALNATSNAYLKRQFAAIDEEFHARYQADGQEGRRRLRKLRN